MVQRRDGCCSGVSSNDSFVLRCPDVEESGNIDDLTRRSTRELVLSWRKRRRRAMIDAYFVLPQYPGSCRDRGRFHASKESLMVFREEGGVHDAKWNLEPR